MAELVSKFIVCYICGREFGSKSIAIHEPQCLQKFENEQSKLPKNQRKPVPVRPENGHAASLKEYNEKALEASNESVLSECPNCSRKFKADSLIVHLRSCTKDGFFAKKMAQRTTEEAKTDIKQQDAKEKIDHKVSSDRAKTVNEASPKKHLPEQERDSRNDSALNFVDKFCSNCGTKFADTNAKFCSECGNKRK